MVGTNWLEACLGLEIGVLDGGEVAGAGLLRIQVMVTDDEGARVSLSQVTE